jgi:hypothetical protein
MAFARPKTLLNLSLSAWVKIIYKRSKQNDIFQIRLKYCMSHVAYILCSAHNKGARRQCNAQNKIYLFIFP